eukprot:9071297-Pyramimonas_sp.AAC.2
MHEFTPWPHAPERPRAVQRAEVGVQTASWHSPPAGAPVGGPQQRAAVARDPPHRRVYHRQRAQVVPIRQRVGAMPGGAPVGGGDEGAMGAHHTYHRWGHGLRVTI